MFPRMAKPKVYQTWTVCKNEPIEKICENLWTVSGMMADGRTQRRMTIAKRSDGDLVIHNAIALAPAEMSEIEAFGRVAYILVPSRFHRMDSFIWKQRYPDAKVLCPKGAHKQVAAVVALDGTYEGFPSDANVKLRELRGCAEFEGVLEVSSADGVTLVFNDSVLNRSKCGGVQGFILALTGKASVPRVVRWLAMKNKAELKQDLAGLASTPRLKRIIVGHGSTIREQAADKLRGAAEDLG